MGAIFGSKTRTRKYTRKKQSNITYYDEISKSLRPFVFWLDELINNPNQIIKMHKHHIHMLEVRAGLNPFHKNKDINKWIQNKVYGVVKIYRINELNAKV